jgi:hypothetical protein
MIVNARHLELRWQARRCKHLETKSTLTVTENWPVAAPSRANTRGRTTNAQNERPGEQRMLGMIFKETPAQWKEELGIWSGDSRAAQHCYEHVIRAHFSWQVSKTSCGTRQPYQLDARLEMSSEQLDARLEVSSEQATFAEVHRSARRPLAFRVQHSSQSY